MPIWWRCATSINRCSARRRKFVESERQKAPAAFTDLRKLLEDKSIAAIYIATPNHQHTLQTIWACQAGKDVYVEKPCSHDMFEARQVAGAARHYDRIVQQGSQARPSTALQDGVQKMREGFLGDVYMARGLCYKWRDTIGRAREQAAPIPARAMRRQTRCSSAIIARLSLFRNWRSSSAGRRRSETCATRHA
jgi:predicted dehydrogenase